MKVGLYAVYDVASGVYDGPVGSMNDATAIRQFKEVATNDNNPIGKNPSDFTLMKVGIWNDADGQIESMPPVKVMTALEAIASTGDLISHEFRKEEAGNA